MVTVIFFTTSTCGYCRPIKEVIEDLKVNYEDDNRIEFTSLVVDQSPSAMRVAVEHNVNAVPTILVFSKATEQERLIGDINREKIVDAIERHL